MSKVLSTMGKLLKYKCMECVIYWWCFNFAPADSLSADLKNTLACVVCDTHVIQFKRKMVAKWIVVVLPWKQRFGTTSGKKTSFKQFHHILTYKLSLHSIYIRIRLLR